MKMFSTPGPYPEPGSLMLSPMTNTFGTVLLSGVGGFPHDPTFTGIPATDSGSCAGATSSSAAVTFEIACSGMFATIDCATEIPVYCCPDGAGAVLKKCNPVVWMAQLV